MRWKSGHLCVILELKGKLSAFTIDDDVIYGFTFTALIIWREVTVILSLLGSFFQWKKILNFLKSFFCICWNNMIFMLHSVSVVYHIYLMYCWIWFGSILLKNFESGILNSVFFFICIVLVWLKYQGNLGLVKWVYSIPSSFTCGEEFKKDCY